MFRQYHLRWRHVDQMVAAVLVRQQSIVLMSNF